MERHQRHAPRLLVVLVLLRDERHLLEELGEAPVGRSLFELGRHTAELAEVLDPALGLDGPFRLELEQVAGLGGRRLDHPLRRRARLERLLQALHHADEPRDRALRARPQIRKLVGPPGRLEERDLLDRRERLERGHGRVADAALGRVDHLPRADHVLRVQQQPQVREDVLDLLALVEPNAADHAVRDAGAHEDVLEHTALGVRAEHGDVRGRCLVFHEPVSLLRDEQRLLVLVVGAETDGQLALGRLGP